MEDRYKEELRLEQAGRQRDKMNRGLELTKDAELHIVRSLVSIGFSVENADPASPFKIVAKSEHYSFVADIKYKRLYRFIPVLITKVELYNTYNSGDLDRLLIIKSRSKSDYPDWSSRNSPDCYITTGNIPFLCYTLGNCYAIEPYHTRPLTVLRKLLEGRTYGEPDFQELLAIGKKAERDVANILSSQGFHITNISNDRTSDGRYCPFDLLGTINGRSVIVQVKRTRAISLFYKAELKELEKWESFVSDAKKILVIVTETQGTRYIKVSDIRKSRFNPSGQGSYIILYANTGAIDRLANDDTI